MADTGRQRTLEIALEKYTSAGQLADMLQNYPGDPLTAKEEDDILAKTLVDAVRLVGG